MNAHMVVSLLLCGLGVTAIVSALTTREFRARAFGVGDRSIIAPWFGRLWTITVGLLFLYAAWKGKLPSVVVRGFAVFLGASLTISNGAALVKPKGTRRAANVWGTFIGILLICAGVLLRVNG
jgi:hypothetical protein